MGGGCYLVAATLSQNSRARRWNAVGIDKRTKRANDRGKCASPCRRRRGRVVHPDESVIDRPNCDCLSDEADAWSEERRRRATRMTSRPERNARNKKKREIQPGTTTIRFRYLIAGALIRQTSQEHRSDLLTIIAEKKHRLGTTCLKFAWLEKPCDGLKSGYFGAIVSTFSTLLMFDCWQCVCQMKKRIIMTDGSVKSIVWDQNDSVYQIHRSHEKS